MVLPQECNCTAGCTPTQPRPPTSAAHTGVLLPPATAEGRTRSAVPLGPTGQCGAPLVGEGSRGLPHRTGSLPPILTFSSLSRTVPQCLRSPKTPRASPDLMQSSPGDVLARSGAVAGTHWGEYPTSPDHRVSLKGKEERGPQPSPPTLEETGRGQAMPPSLEEQEQSCPSPCAAPCPPS